MLEINLLPWRATKRARWLRRKIMVVVSVISILLLSYWWHGLIKTKNNLLQTVVAPVRNIQLDTEIAKIHYVGYVHQGARTWALLLFANGETREVDVGTELTWLNVSITHITERQLTLIGNDHQVRILTLLR